MNLYCRQSIKLWYKPLCYYQLLSPGCYSQKTRWRLSMMTSQSSILSVWNCFCQGPGTSNAFSVFFSHTIHHHCRATILGCSIVVGLYGDIPDIYIYIIGICYIPVIGCRQKTWVTCSDSGLRFSGPGSWPPGGLIFQWFFEWVSPPLKWPWKMCIPWYTPFSEPVGYTWVI